jgi:hypothetical protein
MRAWKDAYRANLSVDQQLSTFELNEADLKMVQGAASAGTGSGLNRLNQLNNSYLQSSNGSVLPLGAVSALTGKLMGL